MNLPAAESKASWNPRRCRRRRVTKVHNLNVELGKLCDQGNRQKGGNGSLSLRNTDVSMESAICIEMLSGSCLFLPVIPMGHRKFNGFFSVVLSNRCSQYARFARSHLKQSKGAGKHAPPLASWTHVGKEGWAPTSPR